MKPDNKFPFKVLDKSKSSEPTDRKRMSEFVKRMKMNAQNSQVTQRNS